MRIRGALRAGVLALPLLLACGPKSAGEASRQVQKETELVEEGGVSPFLARLSFMSPEAMAVQEVPYGEDSAAWNRLQAALKRYRGQWTLRLSIGPKPTAKADPQRPLALDIENNGGQWGDHSRNLQRLMFEMGAYVRLLRPDGTEIEPTLVEFQRSFGMGRDRTFLVVFPGTHQGKALAPPFVVKVGEFGQGMGILRFRVTKAPGFLSDRQVRSMWKASRISGST